MHKDKYYIDEFANYMQWNNEQKQNFIFQNGFSELTDEENKVIKKLLELSDVLINEFSKFRNIDVNIHVYCIKGDILDALCFKANQHYYIAIYSALFKALLDRSRKLAKYILNHNELDLLRKKDKDFIAVQLLMYTYRLILMHEYMHIVLGHCDYVCENSNFLYEVGKENNENVKDISLTEKKALEMLADECACIDIGIKLLQYDNTSKMKEHLLLFYLGETMFFSIFQSNYNNSEDHPDFAFRFNSIAIMMDDIFIRNLDVDNSEAFVYDLDSVIDDLVQIITDCPSVLNIDLLRYLITTDFEREYFKLYNAAVSVVGITNKYAVYKLDTLSPMNNADLQNYKIQKQSFLNDICKCEEEKIMKNECIKVDGFKFEVAKTIADRFNIDSHSAELIFEFIEKNKSILSDEEYFNKEILHTPKGMLGFLTSNNKYSVNIKAITVFIVSLIIDSKINFPATSIGIAVVGLKQLVKTIDEVSGTKCVLLEVLRSKDKKATVDILCENKWQCINNSFNCIYRKENKICTCSHNDIKDILDNLERDGILKKDGEFYLYSPFGYI